MSDGAGGAPTISIAIQGTGIAPSISLGGGTYSFGAVTVPTTKSLTLTNSGSADFVIGTITLASGTNFALAGGSCVTGGTINAAGSCTVSVTFTPSGTTTFNDTLTVSGTGAGTGAPTYATSRALTGR